MMLDNILLDNILLDNILLDNILFNNILLDNILFNQFSLMGLLYNFNPKADTSLGYKYTKTAKELISNIT